MEIQIFFYNHFNKLKGSIILRLDISVGRDENTMKLNDFDIIALKLFNFMSKKVHFLLNILYYASGGSFK